ncbi:PAS domain S-box protein [Nitratireductor sp. GCM10026969]|uniref:PAS domain S-box protein n=1 Tax=Nitratireductor sp. GCM10026969 TaxID=3252645 RepID=UPI00360A15D7
MASAYSFLDIAVLDEVRERFAAGDALAVLAADLQEILWANGTGATWLGYPDIAAAIGGSPRLPPVALRQIAATPGFPDIGRDRPMTLRMTGGLKSRIVTLQASAITLPRGEKALLLALPSPTSEEADVGARIVAGFGEPGHFAALLDAGGRVAAASQGFDSLEVEPETLKALVDEVRTEDDRLVKKRIATRRLPAGIARLTDDPALHLLVVVDDGSAAAPAQTDATPVAVTPHTEQTDETETGQKEQEDANDGASRDESSPAPAARERPAAPTVRFAWRTDQDGRFSALSEEFAEAIGKPAADVIGRSFREVSTAFGLDPDGAIGRLLERRDTWSGRTVMWPLSGTDLKVPVDLAALPVYGRGRVFEGFRGFGIARLDEAQHDPEAIGTVLVETKASPQETQVGRSDEDGVREGTAMNDTAPHDGARPAPETDPFLGETPAISVSTSPERRATDKVIRLAEHREVVRENGLSASERTAFREIGERLRRASEAMAARAAEDGAREDDAQEAQTVTPTAAEVTSETTQEEPAPDTAAEVPPAGETALDAQAATSLPPAANVVPSAFFEQRRDRQKGVDPSPIANLPLPVLIHSGDRLHYANGAFLKLTGYTDLATLEAAGGLGTLFGEPHTEEDETAPARSLRLRTAQGKEVAVEAHLQSIDWEGGKALMLAMHTVPDVAQSETRLSEMRAIIDTATDGVAVIDNDGTIRSISRPAEALFGFEAEHVTGKPFASLFAIESQRTVQDYLTALSDNGVASVLNDGRQVIGREAQGRFIPLFITIGRLPNASGYCAVLRDITHWKRVEEELTQARAEAERASAQKSEFLARVSHEIRTPLNAIIGFSELMIDERFGPIGNGRYRDYLRDIKRSGNHVLDLVNDLLDISKIEAGQQEMQYEAVSLNESLGQVVAMMQPQANSERVIIRSSFASRLPDVVADVRSVRQIALNLLSNAVRYTAAGGQVIVSTAYDPDGSVVLRIRDTGVGMSSAELDEALKPFKQINTLRRKRGDGTGLGLPLTRAMVEANRAQFSITSTPGEGTLVEVTFPSTRVLAE